MEAVGGGSRRENNMVGEEVHQDWQSVGSIRFPDPIPTEISGIRSCSDPEINFNSWIGWGSFLVVQIIGRDRSKLKVYPEFIGHLNEMGSALIKLNWDRFPFQQTTRSVSGEPCSKRHWGRTELENDPTF